LLVAPPDSGRDPAYFLKRDGDASGLELAKGSLSIECKGRERVVQRAKEVTGRSVD
jgi:hypothetical protein